MLKGKLSILLM
jgi:hypothetical protein